jgi:hypothetical protein
LMSPLRSVNVPNADWNCGLDVPLTADAQLWSFSMSESGMK